MIRHILIKQIFLCAIFMALTGCQGFNPVTDTAGYFWNDKKARANLSPGFEYLEVEWQGRKAYMALGYRETQGPNVSEHWYSGQGEMMKLVNGRIVQVFGMTHEVRSVTTNSPVWNDVLTHRSPIVWYQTKDLMPRYRYGLQEFVKTQQITPNPSEKALASDASAWLVEEVRSKDEKGKPWVYQQKFALLGDRVIYSEQCVAQEMCFKLKPLGVVVPK
jgi:hypothetical protein